MGVVSDSVVSKSSGIASQESLEDFDRVLQRAVDGHAITREEGRLIAFWGGTHLDKLCDVAAELRDRARGGTITYSPKVFIPLTQLCRDLCGYCTFRHEPNGSPAFLSPEQVLQVAREGERRGCWEALFTLGERPEQRYSEARQWLDQYGYRSTVDYLRAMSELVLKETRLLPHLNPGTLSRHELNMLRPVSASMGLMLESISPSLYAADGPHALAPSKRPRVRLRTLELAGQLGIPFTTGLLIGLGDTIDEQIDGLLAIRDLHDRYGHVQEVILQNFRAKPNTPMAGVPNPDVDEMLLIVALARILLGPDMNIQVPPNLSVGTYPHFLDAGINDWGGVSPLTIDYVNPEAPWPHLRHLRLNTEARGFILKARLPIYPEYISSGVAFMDDEMRERVLASAGEDGLAREETI